MIQPEGGAEEGFTELTLLAVEATQTREAIRRIFIPDINITNQKGYLNILKPFKYLSGFHSNFYIGHSSTGLHSSPSQIPKAQLPPHHL